MPQAIPYVREEAPIYGSAEWVSPLVRRVTAKNPSKFTYHGTGTYLIGSGQVAVIDAGPDLPDHIDAVMGALEPGETISHLFVTHTHSDHSPATKEIQRQTGARTYGFGPHGPVAIDDPTDVIRFSDPEADGESKPSHAPKDEIREGADTDFVPDVAIADGEIIAYDGWTIRAVHTPGHTSNHLCFELIEEQTLFSGDHVMGWSTSVIAPPDGSLRAYLDSLRLLLRRDDVCYRPTHGAVIENPRALVRAYLAHREERTHQIRAALERGPATIAELVPVIYASVSKGLWRPAAASMYAHLLQLVEEGIAVAEDPGRRTSRFVLSGR